METQWMLAISSPLWWSGSWLATDALGRHVELNGVAGLDERDGPVSTL
jgi:hypothetical protein